MRNAIIYCQRCQRPLEVPPDKVRRKFCDECRVLVMRASGLATGALAQKLTTSKPQ